MADLRAICERAGLRDPRTYLASGNAIFSSDESEADVKATLETALQIHVGKPVGVIVRTGEEMAAVLSASPFAGKPSNRVVAIFLDHPPAADALDHVSGRREEELALGVREIHVFYGEGMASSKLKIPAARSGTARNLNTIAALAKLATG